MGCNGCNCKNAADNEPQYAAAEACNTAMGCGTTGEEAQNERIRVSADVPMSYRRFSKVQGSLVTGYAVGQGTLTVRSHPEHYGRVVIEITTLGEDKVEVLQQFEMDAFNLQRAVSACSLP